MVNNTSLKALLVEDEVHLGNALGIALKKLSIQNHWVQTVGDAKLTLEESEFDLIILDRQLPDGDGMDLCQELRANNYSGLILMLTAKGELHDRIDGLRGGADDYLTKPFSWDELSARIEALCRRIQPRARPWEVDATQLRIHGPKGWVTLTPLEFKLAQHLMHAEGAIVGRDELLKEVWGFLLLPKTRSVDYFLNRLRKIFELNPEAPIHFLTVRGAGYRFQLNPESKSQT